MKSIEVSCRVSDFFSAARCRPLHPGGLCDSRRPRRQATLGRILRDWTRWIQLGRGWFAAREKILGYPARRAADRLAAPPAALIVSAFIRTRHRRGDHAMELAGWEAFASAMW